MIKLLYPKQYVARLFDIDTDNLLHMGIKGILLDLDNTIVPRDCHEFAPEVQQWLQDLLGIGFKLCIVSNNGYSRVNTFAGPLNIPLVVRAVKPRKRPFMRAMDLIGTSSRETAVIGDQIFTDILGGNRLGLHTILVTPMPGKEFWATKMFSRRLERYILDRLSYTHAGNKGEHRDE